MYKIGIIDLMNIKGINLLKEYKDFECELVTDLSHKNLFSIGEVVDVTGHLGGYNFQWAWSSGYVAGKYV